VEGFYQQKYYLELVEVASPADNPFEPLERQSAYAPEGLPAGFLPGVPKGCDVIPRAHGCWEAWYRCG
jgi:hypothetical protein